jgi:hypothetical protein
MIRIEDIEQNNAKRKISTNGEYQDHHIELKKTSKIKLNQDDAKSTATTHKIKNNKSKSFLPPTEAVLEHEKRKRSSKKIRPNPA